MPDRIIRDELLTSPRYWAVSIEAQRLFVHLLLCADDTARFSGKNYTIRLACFPGHAVDPTKIENLLAELMSEDLIRLYQVDDERFMFVPRFKQRLRYKRSKYPEPPKEIRDIDDEKTDLSQTQDGLKSAEVKRSEVNTKTRVARATLERGFDRFWEAYPKKRSKGEARKAWIALRPDDALLDSILKAVEGAKRGADWLKDGGRFIPHPASWLRSQGWLDELDQEKPRRLAL